MTGNRYIFCKKELNNAQDVFTVAVIHGALLLAVFLSSLCAFLQRRVKLFGAPLVEVGTSL